MVLTSSLNAIWIWVTRLPLVPEFSMNAGTVVTTWGGVTSFEFPPNS